MKKHLANKDEKGFILILALVTMVMMTIIGISLVMNITTDMQLARNEREAKVAFQLANAGLNEAKARLHLSSIPPSINPRYIGEKTTDAGYRTTAWAGHTFSSDPTYLGALGANQSYSVTLKYLDETNPEGFCDSNNAGPNTSVNALTYPSTWTCTNNPPEVVMYGQDFKIPPSVTGISYGIMPIYRAISTGTSNGTSRTIEAYIGASKLNTDTSNAINANSCITVAGGSNTITGGVVQGPGCACDPQLSGGCLANKTATTDMTTYLGDTLTNIMSYSDQVHSCTNPSCSAPGNDIPTSGKIDALLGTPTNGSLIFINNTGGVSAKITGTLNGEGILIVTGDLVISGNVTWEGLIYVMGTLTISGSVNVEGGMMANNTVQLNGSVTAKYDQGDLAEVSRLIGSTAMVVWKRM